MTREEAKATLKGEKWICCSEKWNEALEMVIKALEQEPCEELYRLITDSNSLMLLENYKTGERTVIEKRLEPCEDCISRKALIEYANNLKDGIGITANDIARFPSIQPKPKTGHWILQPSNKEQGERDFIWWKCSECGQVIYSETEQDRQEYHAYCGRCGAKMLPTDSEKE